MRESARPGTYFSNPELSFAIDQRFFDDESITLILMFVNHFLMCGIKYDAFDIKNITRYNNIIMETKMEG